MISIGKKYFGMYLAAKCKNSLGEAIYKLKPDENDELEG